MHEKLFEYAKKNRKCLYNMIRKDKILKKNFNGTQNMEEKYTGERMV